MTSDQLAKDLGGATANDPINPIFIFDFDDEPKFWADVKVRHIGGQDQNLPMQFKDIGLVKWRKLLAKYSKEQLDKDDIESGPKHEAAALSDIIVGWKIANGDGKRLPYNKKNLIKLCGYTWFTQAVISAYSENLTGIVSEPGKGT